MQCVRAAMTAYRQQVQRELRSVATSPHHYAATRRWRGTRAHNATSATRKAMMRGCKIHTPYRSEIAPVMLMSSGEASRADPQQIQPHTISSNTIHSQWHHGTSCLTETCYPTDRARLKLSRDDLSHDHHDDGVHGAEEETDERERDGVPWDGMCKPDHKLECECDGRAASVRRVDSAEDTQADKTD